MLAERPILFYAWNQILQILKKMTQQDIYIT